MPCPVSFIITILKLTLWHNASTCLGCNDECISPCPKHPAPLLPMANTSSSRVTRSASFPRLPAKKNNFELLNSYNFENLRPIKVSNFYLGSNLRLIFKLLNAQFPNSTHFLQNRSWENYVKKLENLFQTDKYELKIHLH